MKKIVNTVLIPVAVGVAITLIVQSLNRGAQQTQTASAEGSDDGIQKPMYA